MSLRAFHWAWSQTNLNPTEKLVLCEIADGWNDAFGYAWAGHPRMATNVNVSLNTLKRTIANLVECGLVKIEAVKGSTNRYSLPTYPGQNGLTPGQIGPGQNGLQTKISGSLNSDKEKWRRASALPPRSEWLDPDVKEWTAAQTTRPVEELAEHFEDHAKANGTTHKDWTAAFRTWVRKDVSFHGAKPVDKTQKPGVTASKRERRAYDGLPAWMEEEKRKAKGL